MELSRFSDYSLRVLMYTAAKGDEKVTLGELANVYRISQHHLVKIVHYLGKLGYLKNRRGRCGGIRMGKDAADIRVGDVIRQTETHFHLTECFNLNNNLCRLAPGCRLKGVFQQACDAFLAVLDEYTLEDLVTTNRPSLLLLSLQQKNREAGNFHANVGLTSISAGTSTSPVAGGGKSLWSLPLKAMR